MYKLLITDVDGTLVRRDGSISEENIRALQLAKAAGVHVSLCTGRSMLSCLHLITGIGLNNFHGFYDGAFICHQETRDVLYTEAIEPPLVERLTRFAEESGSYLELSSGLRSFSTDEVLPQEFKRLFFDTEHTVGQWDEIPKQEPIVQGLLVATTEKMNAGLSELKEELDGSLQLLITQNPAYPGVTVSVILASRASKATALEKLAEHHGISAQDVMAVGDWRNDTAMLAKAGLGVAMDNAPDDVKAAADRVTASVEENGLAKAIDVYLLA